ncbi:hypothetical protein AB6A40_008328 [Gnathostoma spinigerum]|uniref:J domain-containing protein n=1 Tax=Gnathostoma spinigerum TaxID=75299 RepID=A0ABD6EWH7_9BILA
MEANRSEAQRCIDLAREALRKKKATVAKKFLSKAAQLDPTADVRYLTEKANRLEQDDTSSEGATGTDAGYGHYDQYEGGEFELRNRSRRTQFHASKSQPYMNADNGHPVGDEGSSSSADPRKSKSRSRSAGRIQKGYTKEEEETVTRIRHCKDYYEILNVSKDASDAELKREYRRLALQLHPDKCHAPGATEAFKALGNAYAILSNKEKRAQYDAYGAEGPRKNSSQGEFYEYDYGRGFEAEFTPEEIFNMFFGGDGPAFSYINRRHRGATYHFHQQNAAQQEQSPYAPILQLFPLIAVLLICLVAQLLVGEPAFSLQRSSKYSEERFTADLRIPYYVKPDFLSTYRGRISQVEHQVEDEYISRLRINCYKEKSSKDALRSQAYTLNSMALLNRANGMQTPSCDRLQEIYS